MEENQLIGDEIDQVIFKSSGWKYYEEKIIDSDPCFAVVSPYPTVD